MSDGGTVFRSGGAGGCEESGSSGSPADPARGDSRAEAIQDAARPAGDLIAELARTTDTIVSVAELEQLLATGHQLRIKYGVDVTAPHLHLGHAVNLWMMRRLQDLGHRVLFLIGDFTTRIGDPTGQDRRRPVIPEADIQENADAFIAQAKMVLRFDDPQLLEIRRNSEWYAGLSAADLLGLLSMVTHARLTSRDLFAARIAAGADIHMHELVYPVLQGYDSVALQSDLTIIGSDQLFNEMLGRFYQERFGQRPQAIITTKITPGIDGRAKQSKCLGNYIGLGHSPRDKFGRAMRVPDDLIVDYFTVYTDVPLEEVARVAAEVAGDPMGCKLRLAEAIVGRYHGAEAAARERQWFVETFSARRPPADAPALPLEPGAYTAFEVVKRCFSDQKSHGEIRRLFQQGAVWHEGARIGRADDVVHVHDGDVFRVGRRAWFRVRAPGQ